MRHGSAKQSEDGIADVLLDRARLFGDQVPDLCEGLIEYALHALRAEPDGEVGGPDDVHKETSHKAAFDAALHRGKRAPIGQTWWYTSSLYTLALRGEPDWQAGSSLSVTLSV